MKRFTQYTIGAVFALALSGAAWAQQRDLEVTMDVVPANAPAGTATGEIKLPNLDTASARGQESSAFGRGIANAAREAKGDLREFGQGVSDAAQAQTRAPNLPPQSKRP